MAFFPGSASKKTLKGVHPRVIKVVLFAYTISECDMSVVDGLRTIEEQRRNVESGASQTMVSFHLKQKDGYSHAVDLYPWVDGKTNFEEKYQLMICKAMQLAANHFGEKIEMGCFWVSYKNKNGEYGDKPHFQFIIK